MVTHTIRLPRGQWSYDDAQPLGNAGGFGEVFRGSGANGEVAVKRLKLTASEAAHRELDIAEHLASKQRTHIVPIIDAGQDTQSDRYFLVMPICEHSLQDAIRKAGKISPPDAIAIVKSILRGLQDVVEITHRDLKPANVLFHEGIWKIADFGIAKFVEDSTSFQTLRSSLTPAYAAPEQWLGDRPTAATDIYAVGCIMFALLTGVPPFSGSADELREKHLHEIPRRLDDLPSREAAFVSHMLRKIPAARPSLERCIQIFSSPQVITPRSSAAMSALAKVAREIAEREARAEAEEQAAATRKKWRTELVRNALPQLTDLRSKLIAVLDDVFESAHGGSEAEKSLGYGSLRFSIPVSLDENSLDWIEGWGAVCSVTISVTQIGHVPGYHRWSATLFYGGPNPEADCRWYEVAFINRHFASHGAYTEKMQPISREIWPDLISGLNTSEGLAYGPVPIDAEDEEAFVHRWCALFARAAVGTLREASTLPIAIDSLSP